jgi:hypothetical protein
MTEIDKLLNAAKTEALKLEHHYPLSITHSVRRQFSTFLTGKPVSVYHGYAYVECGVINHHTLKETIKTIKVKFFNK